MSAQSLKSTNEMFISKINTIIWNEYLTCVRLRASNRKLNKRQIRSSVNKDHAKQIAVYHCSLECNRNETIWNGEEKICVWGTRNRRHMRVCTEYEKEDRRRKWKKLSANLRSWHNGCMNFISSSSSLSSSSSQPQYLASFDSPYMRDVRSIATNSNINKEKLKQNI